MEVRYKREVNHNYMILDAPSEGGGYECRMLASNTIEGLLRFRVRQYEDKREFYYEITSRQPLNRLLEQRKINGGEIRSILLSLSRVLSKIEEYLLKEEQILLEPEFIYIDPDRFTVSLCLLPGYSCDFPAALSELLRFLLEKINHKDREGVVMAYNLYHESLRENYGMSDLLRHLRETEDVIFKRRDDSRDESREQHKTEDEFRTYIPEENKAIDGIGSVRPIYEHVGKEDSKEHFTEEKYTGRIKAAAATAKITKTLQCFLMFLAMEGGIWYFTGREGISRYGLPAAMAAGAAAAVSYTHLDVYKRQDRENLKNTVNQIIAIREAMNLMSLLKDPEKRREAELLAAAITGASGIAPLVSVTTFFILTVWALAESVEDVKALLEGGKVPFLKQEREWRVSLTGLAESGTALFRELGASGNEGEGLDYQSYLKLLFWLSGLPKKEYRMMDMIQKNIRTGQPSFLMRKCAYRLEAEYKGRGTVIPISKKAVKAY